MRFPLAALTLVVAGTYGQTARAAALQLEPGTWSADCARHPPLETIYVNEANFVFGEAKCDFGKWTKTPTGMATSATCAGDGITPTVEQFIVTPQSAGRSLIAFGGGRFVASFCGASTGDR